MTKKMDKIPQNPLKSCDFVWNRKIAIKINGFCLFWDSIMEL